MIRKTILAALALTSIPVVWCQSVQSPYSSNYALVSLGPVPSFGNYYGSLTFLNASALLLTDGVEGGSVPIYQLPVNRGPDGHITSLGTPVHYASAAFLDAGLAFGPGGILFARNTNSVLYEFKPGSTSPDLSVDLTTFGYPHDSFGTLQFVPPGLPGAGSLKVPDFSTGKWYDVVLAPNTSGTYDVSSVNGPNATASADPMGIFYVPLGSPQFSSPSVLVAHYYTGPIYAYSLDSNGNPAGSGTAFIAGNFSPYGAAFDPLTGDMLFTTTLTGEDVYEVQGFSAGSLTGTAGGRQSAVVDRHFASPLTVTLRDPYGTPIGGVTVNFAAPTSGASAALSAGSAVTAADGTASITATANTTAGSYSVTATLYGLSTTFSFTNVALQSVALSPASVVGGGSTTGNTITVTSAAPPGGATIGLTSSNPAVAAVPASVAVAHGSTVSQPFTITTNAVAALTHVTIQASDGVNHKTAFLTVKPAVLTAVKLSPRTVVGGKSTAGNTVTLNGPAPAAGDVVTLSSSDPAVAGVPDSVTVPAGATVSPVFTITTTAAAAQTSVTISATYDGATRTATLTVDPPQAAAVKLSPASVTGGQSTTHNAVVLDGPAPAGGAIVMLTSGNSAVAAVPATVTVASGATYATFAITTTAVTADTVVPVTATFGGASVMANLTVTP
ncbi:MAG: Ig-like domain-containing protein [Bryobacteraceae bacterium]